MSTLYRNIPSVDSILKFISDSEAIAELPRPMVRDLINDFLDICRQKIKDQEITQETQLSLDSLKSELIDFIRDKSRPNFRRVINATGVVIHTNLGRSILSQEATLAVEQSCQSYSNLEFDLKTGKRGSRYALVEDILCELTGAEGALVVNNNAAAVLLMLDTLAKGKEVIVSRGQLVEIGGSFRIPEVMAKSGAILKEVGATNRTHLYDYQNAIGHETAAILKAHTSNYRIIGFHKEVELTELVKLGHKYNLPVLEDLGSGNFFQFPDYTRIDEPTVQSVLKTGVSVVSFSGDKMLGGPQAGIILGKKDPIEKIKKNPLNRAVRIDKMTLAALEATLRLYKDPEMAREKIPTINMICQRSRSLKGKATRIAFSLRKEISDSFHIYTQSDSSRVGGGASPELDLPTQLICLQPKIDLSLKDLRDRLLQTDPPVVGRVEDQAFCLDPRTLLKSDLPLLVKAFKQAIS